MYSQEKKERSTNSDTEVVTYLPLKGAIWYLKIILLVPKSYLVLKWYILAPFEHFFFLLRVYDLLVCLKCGPFKVFIGLRFVSRKVLQRGQMWHPVAILATCVKGQ